MKLLVILPFLYLSFIFVPSIFGQDLPCLTDFIGTHYETDVNASNPPYSADMPESVAIAYRFLDSLTKSSNIDEFYGRLWRQDYNDTLLTVMKYLYKTIEYSPEIFLNYLIYGELNKQSVMDYYFAFVEQIRRASPTPILDASLTSSYLVARVTVNSILMRATSYKVQSKTVREVIATVDTIFKGKQLLTCGDEGSNTAQTLNCLKFDYVKEWFEDKNPNFEMELNKSYLIFFEYRMICITEASTFFSLLPLSTAGSAVRSIYPIENDNLIDEHNELGFGTSVPINTVIDGINSRIKAIKNYKP
ncbi:MAG: actin-related protein 2/3 complex subunit 5 family protein [Candidatus Kapabacteria bacterium]|nr:actin-related protein 2/3 complex subunit 5 family protein [Candidatus Kapabacteria bacterium]